jgi:hypothetical protein
METFQRVRESALKCWSAIFSFLIAFFRALTDSVLAILTSKTWLVSSPSTQQLSLSVAVMMCCFVEVRMRGGQIPTTCQQRLQRSVLASKKRHLAASPFYSSWLVVIYFAACLTTRSALTLLQLGYIFSFSESIHIGSNVAISEFSCIAQPGNWNR